VPLARIPATVNEYMLYTPYYKKDTCVVLVVVNIELVCDAIRLDLLEPAQCAQVTTTILIVSSSVVYTEVFRLTLVRSGHEFWTNTLCNCSQNHPLSCELIQTLVT
jgi:hypothetical protein